MGRNRRRAPFLLVIASLCGGVLTVPGVPDPAAAAPGDPVPINVTVGAANGEGRIEAPGRACTDGGTGAYWNYDYDAPLTPGVFSGLPGELALHLALHSDQVRYPNTGPALPVTPAAEAFLQGEDSFAVLENDRGTVKVRLRSGTCTAPTLQFDGGTTSGTGTWTVDSGQGAYRDVAGSGTFTLGADVDPGADNPFNLNLAGSLDVLQPELFVQVRRTFWGSLGTDYLTRRVTVLYEIKNVGTGDAFNASIFGTTPSTPGVTVVNTEDPYLGDLGPGESEYRTVRFQLGLGQPCQLVLLNCKFIAGTTVRWSDALDVVSTPTYATQAKAPNLPPPL